MMLWHALAAVPVWLPSNDMGAYMVVVALGTVVNAGLAIMARGAIRFIDRVKPGLATRSVIRFIGGHDVCLGIDLMAGGTPISSGLDQMGPMGKTRKVPFVDVPEFCSPVEFQSLSILGIDAVT